MSNYIYGSPHCGMCVGSWLSINGEAIYKTKPWQNYQNDTLNNNFWYVKYISSNKIQNFDLAQFLTISRYTYRPDTGDVYGTLTQKYQSKVMLHLIVGSSSKVSMIGYDGEVSWTTYTNDTVEISMPPLPLDTELRWAWVFKFENIQPPTKY